MSDERREYIENLARSALVAQYFQFLSWANNSFSFTDDDAKDAMNNFGVTQEDVDWYRRAIDKPPHQ